MNKLFYFAYGSNMWHERIIERLGLTPRRGIYRLLNYTLVFNAGWHKRCAYANIMAANPIINDYVEGVLYEPNDRQIAELDKYEGYPVNYQKRYKSIIFNGEEIIIFWYESTNYRYIVNEAKPALSYLNIILDGCAQNGLNETYEKLLMYKLNNYTVKFVINKITNKRITKRSKNV
jgi:gamma-glutamylcyclotransferase (GGCT)/AIG2-like uncharacterized protein YtfP